MSLTGSRFFEGRREQWRCKMTSQRHLICKSCGSENNGKLGGEIGLHFKGIGGLDKPIVFVFSEVVVCLSCGHAEFRVPETELRVLETNTPVENAAIVMSSGDPSNDQFQPRTEVKRVATTDETITPRNRTKRRR